MKHVKCYRPGYPRPQLVRGRWESLDGLWDFLQTDSAATSQWSGGFVSEAKIRVPFAVEAPLSGIGDAHPARYLWYCRRVQLSDRRAVLHFEGSDRVTDVWLNGEYVGGHTGGYARFSFRLHEFAKEGENVLAVRVCDDDSREHPRGKQRWLQENFLCWYVQTSGIYKSVWLETVPETYVESLRVTPSAERGEVRVEVRPDRFGPGLRAEVVAEYGGTVAASAGIDLNCPPSEAMQEEPRCAVLSLGTEHLWSAEHPALYDLTVRLKKDGAVVDEVGSYCALRDVACVGQDILVNGEKIYLKMVLDQGYWEDGHLTPPDEAALLYDLQYAKDAGFNGVRKHQKTEDERFYYLADVLGMYVWCEMPSMYAFNERSRHWFVREWTQVQAQFYNHPSIMAWVPLNESWGVWNVRSDREEQAFASAVYRLTKAGDATRPAVGNDGWEHTDTDILTIHIYEQDGARLREGYKTLREAAEGSALQARRPFAEGYVYGGQPIVFSEFGGTALRVDEVGGAWGYGNGVSGADALRAKADELISAVKSFGYASGYCYTQLTDVQQEVNGLLRADRTPKIAAREMKKINDR